MSRFFLGVCTGGVGTFYVLREITERRLVTWKRPDAGLTDAYTYHRRLRRMILDEQHQFTRADSFSETFRRTNNSLLRSLVGKGEPGDLSPREALNQLFKAFLESIF